MLINLPKANSKGSGYFADKATLALEAILVLFHLLPQAAILDVLDRITPPVYTPLYIDILGCLLQCTLPLSKYPASED